MAYSQRPLLLTIFWIFLTFSASDAAETDSKIVGNNTYNCPRNCKCGYTEIRCSSALTEGIYYLPGTVKKL